ncbi:MAG: N-acetyltransferase family protein [Halieaceae bacterium]|jgi:phosphinothricin acetyltransferase|nr:N-acetyltransferase family protein [Halieaceae bacterium]
MIRAARESDGEPLAALYNHYVRHTATTFETEPINGRDMFSRVAAVQQIGLPWLVLEEDGKLQGYACAVRWKGRAAYQNSVESTIYLAEGLGGRGLGTLLYEELLAQLRNRGMHCALGGIALPNAASVALHERMGFEKVAHLKEVGRKFDRWIDVGYWQCMLDR